MGSLSKKQSLAEIGNDVFVHMGAQALEVVRVKTREFVEHVPSDAKRTADGDVLVMPGDLDRLNAGLGEGLLPFLGDASQIPVSDISVPVAIRAVGAYFLSQAKPCLPGAQKFVIDPSCEP